MDTNDKTAIQTLFDKLGQVEQRFPDRDTEAEAFIADLAARQPGALYYLAQTVITQEHALKAAEEKLRKTEADLAAARNRDTRGTGSFLSGLFGAGPSHDTAEPGYSAMPRVSRNRGAAPSMSQEPVQSGGAPGRTSGQRSFLGGAAQTALGVAGGVMLGEMVSSMFGHHGMGMGGVDEVIVDREVIDDRSAGADDQGQQFDNAGFDNSGFDNAGFDDGGFDVGGFDDDDWA